MTGPGDDRDEPVPEDRSDPPGPEDKFGPASVPEDMSGSGAPRRASTGEAAPAGAGTRIRLTRAGLRILVGPRVPWWGRLESRVITALAALGILCVGASAYLVTLTVTYFDSIVVAAARKSDDAVAAARPLYDGFVRASKLAYRARTAALARELELGLLRAPEASGGPEELADWTLAALRAVLEREGDVVELRLDGLVAGPRLAERRQLFPEDPLQWIWFTAGPEPLDRAPGAIAEGLTLTATFAQSTELDRRYQALGAAKRELDYVAVNGSVVDRGELEGAVFRAIGAASALVLMVAFIAGFLLARATTISSRRSPSSRGPEKCSVRSRPGVMSVYRLTWPCVVALSSAGSPPRLTGVRELRLKLSSCSRGRPARATR